MNVRISWINISTLFIGGWEESFQAHVNTLWDFLTENYGFLDEKQTMLQPVESNTILVGTTTMPFLKTKIIQM